MDICGKLHESDETRSQISADKDIIDWLFIFNSCCIVCTISFPG